VALDLAAHQALVVERLRAKHEAREATLTASRQAIRHAADAIRAVHRGERERARGLIDRCGALLAEAEQACEGQPQVEFAGFLADARKEYAEASCTYAIAGGEAVPGPDEVGVGEAEWCNGLAETVGELRRQALDHLRHGELERSEELLEAMDDIYALLASVDFPEGVTGGLRRSTDVARSIIERTRGDLTSALVQDRLRQALERHRSDVLGE
jgi:translin